MFAEVLRVKRVGVHDNFFEMGGHSLMATRVVSRMRQMLSVELPLHEFFAMPTIAGVARCVEAMDKDGRRDGLADELTAIAQAGHKRAEAARQEFRI